MDAEARLMTRGVPIDSADLPRSDEPDIIGYFVLYPEPWGARVFLQVPRSISMEDRNTFAEWAESRLDRFLESGPEPDGWQKRTSDGGWQLWARKVLLPPL
jgi:hypothetical protein